MREEKFDITGMTCSACSARVEKATAKLDGMGKLADQQHEGQLR